MSELPEHAAEKTASRKIIMPVWKNLVFIFHSVRSGAFLYGEVYQNH
jgi:hypothetical protein